MARKRERIFALVGAVLFLATLFFATLFLTAVAFGAAVFFAAVARTVVFFAAPAVDRRGHRGDGASPRARRLRIPAPQSNARRRRVRRATFGSPRRWHPTTTRPSQRPDGRASCAQRNALLRYGDRRRTKAAGSSGFCDRRRVPLACKRLGLRAIEPHGHIEPSLRRRQPVGLLVLAGALVLEIEVQRPVGIVPEGHP